MTAMQVCETGQFLYLCSKTANTKGGKKRKRKSHHSENCGFACGICSSQEIDISGIATQLYVVGDEVRYVRKHTRMSQVLELDHAPLIIYKLGPATGFA